MITPVLLPFQSSMLLIISGLLMKGLGAGPLISCSYTACLKAAKSSGRPDDSKTYSLVSTIVSLSIPLGLVITRHTLSVILFFNSNFVGGLSAPILYSEFGMVNSASVFMMIFTSLALTCAILDRRRARIQFSDIHYERLSSS